MKSATSIFRRGATAVRCFPLARGSSYLLARVFLPALLLALPPVGHALTAITNLNLPSVTNVEQIVFSDGSVQTTAASNSTAVGAGFPLTNDSSAAFFSITNVNYFEAQDIRASNDVRVGDSLYVTNNIFAEGRLDVNGELEGNSLDINGSGDISGDLTVHGDLDVIGNTYQTTVINLSTNVYVGTTTNYVTTTVYSTNVVYQYTYVGTNTYITNNVNIDTYVNVNGTWDGTNADWVALPGLYSDGPVADGTTNTATGAWDFSGADVTGLATEGTTNASGINLDTSNFDLNLSATDTNVQTAMETLDELITSAAYTNLFGGQDTTGAVSSAAADADKFLRADGTWQDVALSGVTNPLFVGSVTNDGRIYLGVDTNSTFIDVEVSGGTTNLYVGNVSTGTFAVEEVDLSSYLGATNDPTAGQMLYASGTSKAELYFGDAPEGGGGAGTATTILLQDGDWPHDGSPSRASDLLNGLATFGYSFDDTDTEATFPAFCALASTNQDVWTHSGYIYSAETNGMTNVTFGLKIQSGGTTYWSTNTQTVVGADPDTPEAFSYTFTQQVADAVCHISLWGGGYATNNGDFVTIANKVMVQE